MPHSDRLRVVLIEPAAHPLPGLAPALLAEPRLELTPLDLQPGRLSAKSAGIEQLERIIDKNPQAVAMLLRNWLSEEAK